jgi:seryl-tRNA synthetase
MLDIRFIRENVELVRKGLEAKNASGRLDEVLSLDEQRRKIIVKVD